MFKIFAKRVGVQNRHSHTKQADYPNCSPHFKADFTFYGIFYLLNTLQMVMNCGQMFERCCGNISKATRLGAIGNCENRCIGPKIASLARKREYADRYTRSFALMPDPINQVIYISYYCVYEHRCLLLKCLHFQVVTDECCCLQLHIAQIIYIYIFQPGLKGAP